MRVDRIRIEQHQVGGHTLPNLPRLGIPKNRACTSKTTHRLFQRQRLSLAHPAAKQVGGVRSVTEHIDMRAAIRETDHEARIGDEPL